MRLWQSLWDRSPIYRETLEKRIMGALPPMEANKHLAETLREVSVEGDTLLDAGCGAGHFLRLYTDVVPESRITGIDVSDSLLAIARQHYPAAAFTRSTIEEFAPPAPFDHVTCCNVLMHVANLRVAIDRLLALSRKTLHVRMLIGDATYLIRHVHSTDSYAGISDIPPSEELDASGAPVDFHHFNIYSRAFIASLLDRPDVEAADIVPDTFMDLAALARERKGRYQTRVVDGQLVIGNIICPWAYVHVRKKRR